MSHVSRDLPRRIASQMFPSLDRNRRGHGKASLSNSACQRSPKHLARIDFEISVQPARSKEAKESGSEAAAHTVQFKPIPTRAAALAGRCLHPHGQKRPTSTCTDAGRRQHRSSCLWPESLMAVKSSTPLLQVACGHTSGQTAYRRCSANSPQLNMHPRAEKEPCDKLRCGAPPFGAYG